MDYLSLEPTPTTVLVLPSRSGTGLYALLKASSTLLLMNLFSLLSVILKVSTLTLIPTDALLPKLLDPGLILALSSLNLRIRLEVP